MSEATLFTTNYMTRRQHALVLTVLAALWFQAKSVFGAESAAVLEELLKTNRCAAALQENGYHVTGIWGSSLESEWSRVSAQVQMKEMERLGVVQKHTRMQEGEWDFEFVELTKGKLVAFVFSVQSRNYWCGNRPNAFFVVKRD